MATSESTVDGAPLEGRWGPVLGVVLIACGMLGLAAIQYAMPDSLRYPGPINPAGARDFARWLSGGVSAPMSVGAFVWWFRGLVVLAWTGYGIVVYTGLRRGITRPMRVLAFAAVLSVLLAVVFPPSLSHDLYAYLGFGRMGALYGLNPYVHTLQEAARHGDVAALRYGAPTTNVYGPVWTLLVTGLAWVLRGAAIPVQLVALKLIEACALVGGAVAAREVARSWNPRYADLALVAFALNPLILLEGPGNGHNDVLMVALMLAGLALAGRSSWRLGYVLLGASVGVKFVSLAIVPWVILEQVRTMPWRPALARATASGGLVLATVLGTLLSFWTGLGTLSGLGVVYGMKSQGSTTAHAGVVFVLLLYVAMTAWVWRGAGDRLAPAWTVWSAAGVLFALPGVLPWYLSWPTSVTLTRWDRRQIALSTGVMLVSLCWMLRYTALSGG